MPEETSEELSLSPALPPGNYQVVAWDLDTTGMVTIMVPQLGN